jgi:hypothetical protein
MSASMLGFCFDGLKVSPVLDLSGIEIGVPSALAESDRGSGKSSIDNSCDPQVYQGGEYYG